MDNMSGTVMSETEDDDGQLSKKDVSLFFLTHSIGDKGLGQMLKRRSLW